jgi:hypothetical protein
MLSLFCCFVCLTTKRNKTRAKKEGRLEATSEGQRKRRKLNQRQGNRTLASGTKIATRQATALPAYQRRGPERTERRKEFHNANESGRKQEAKKGKSLTSETKVDQRPQVDERLLLLCVLVAK